MDSSLVFRENGTFEKVEGNLDSTSAIPLLEKALERTVPQAPTTADEMRAGGSVRVFDFVFSDDGTVKLREIGPGEIHTSAQSASLTQNSPGTDDNGGGSLSPIPGQ